MKSHRFCVPNGKPIYLEMCDTVEVIITVEPQPDHARAVVRPCRKPGGPRERAEVQEQDPADGPLILLRYAFFFLFILLCGSAVVILVFSVVNSRLQRATRQARLRAGEGDR